MGCPPAISFFFSLGITFSCRLPWAGASAAEVGSYSASTCLDPADPSGTLSHELSRGRSPGCPGCFTVTCKSWYDWSSLQRRDGAGEASRDATVYRSRGWGCVRRACALGPTRSRPGGSARPLWPSWERTLLAARRSRKTHKAERTGFPA